MNFNLNQLLKWNNETWQINLYFLYILLFGINTIYFEIVNLNLLMILKSLTEGYSKSIFLNFDYLINLLLCPFVIYYSFKFYKIGWIFMFSLILTRFTFLISYFTFYFNQTDYGTTDNNLLNLLNSFGQMSLGGLIKHTLILSVPIILLLLNKIRLKFKINNKIILFTIITNLFILGIISLF